MDDLNQNSNIQSIDYSAQILELFCANHDRLSLKAIATSLNDSPAKVFRYLVSLTRIGLLNKTSNNEYEIGDLALDLSFKSLGLLDPIEEACDTAKIINSETTYGVAVSIWGSLGPTVIKTFEPTESVYSQIRVGSVMSILNSSIGNTFAKYLPEHILKPALDIEELRHSGRKISNKEKVNFINNIKEEEDHLFTLMIDRPSLGLSSISFPVFSNSDEVQFVITVFHNSSLILKNIESFKIYLVEKMYKLSRNIGAE